MRVFDGHVRTPMESSYATSLLYTGWPKN